MTHERPIGRYLAQGLGANLIASFLLLVSLFLWAGNDGAGLMVLLALPIYWFIAGPFGLATAAGVWIFEYVIDRKLNVWLRALFGVVVPFALAALIALLWGFLGDPLGILGVAMFFGIVMLPAALVSGSRVNPLKFVVMDLRSELPEYGWARALSIIGVPLLRVSSTFGVLEAFLNLASLRSPALGSWDVAEKQFSESIVAVLYFAVTLIVSLCLPDKIIVVVAGLIANAPLVFFALSVESHARFNALFLARVSWVFVALWILFLVSQLMRSETRRIIPVTLFEIRIRSALNYW